MKTWLLVLLVAALLALHQDTWFWNTAHPLAFGFLPIGLFYHGVYSLAVAFVMMVLVRHAWPTELEQQAGEDDG